VDDEPQVEEQVDPRTVAVSAALAAEEITVVLRGRPGDD
jgi:hypothetical protein